MKPATTVRLVGLSTLSIFLILAVAAGGLGFEVAVSKTPLVPPTITSRPANPASSSTAIFSFTGPAVATFRCQLDGSDFAPCSIQRTYAGLSQGAHTFSVQAIDAAGTGSALTIWSWTIDSVPPAAPVLTMKPSDPTFNATNTFAWSPSEPDLTFQCSQENVAWFACSTPYAWVLVISSYGQHELGVRAIDAARNVSAATFYSFKYEKMTSRATARGPRSGGTRQLPTSGVPFQITGSVSGLTLGIYRPILVRITNPNSVMIFVSALQVSVASDSTPTGCTSSANVDLLQSNVSTSQTVAVPAKGSVVLPAQGARAPKIRLKNLPTVNQDACMGKSFALAYSGTASD